MSKIITNQMEILEQTEGYNVSERYNVIPTMDVVQQFERYGFELTNVESAGFRNSSKENKQPHMVRMKAEYDLAPGLRPEVIIHNSYDGTKALNIRVGLFRFVCANGIVAGSNLIPSFQIKHSNSHWAEAINEFVDTYEEKHYKQKEWISNMTETQFSLDEAYHLAEQAHKVRHSDKRISDDIVDPLQLLITRRREDKGNSAWMVYNRIQESLTHGLFDKYDNEGNIRKAKVLTNIDEIIRMNVDLSDLFGNEIAC